jgi:serine/threonine protein kinase
MHAQQVTEAKLRESGKAYAIKVLDKSHLKRNNKLSTALAEKNVLVRLGSGHPGIVRLHWAFQDEWSLCTSSLPSFISDGGIVAAARLDTPPVLYLCLSCHKVLSHVMSFPSHAIEKPLCHVIRISHRFSTDRISQTLSSISRRTVNCSRSFPVWARSRSSARGITPHSSPTRSTTCTGGA